jgi:hypothetical protein
MGIEKSHDAHFAAEGVAAHGKGPDSAHEKGPTSRGFSFPRRAFADRALAVVIITLGLGHKR